MKKTSSRTIKVDPYEAYTAQYGKNIDKLTGRENPVTVENLTGKMQTREQFENDLQRYRVEWQKKHPGSHGESADRIAKWVANKQTEDRSYKQARHIKRVAKELGFDLKMDDIRFNSPKTGEFWNAYLAAKEAGIDVSQLWGSK